MKRVEWDPNMTYRVAVAFTDCVKVHRLGSQV